MSDPKPTMVSSVVSPTESVYLFLDMMDQYGEPETLIINRLYAFTEGEVEGWMDIHFMEVRTVVPCNLEQGEYDRIELDRLLSVSGPAGTLREARHWNFGEDGYLFSPSHTYLRAILTYLEKYFDGN